MNGRTARVIDLEEYRTHRESLARERSVESVGFNPVWWFPMVMWIPVRIPALYWRQAALE
jgi:hypothetical protein